jgi:hypothetical protein
MQCVKSQSARLSEAPSCKDRSYYKDNRHFFEWWYIDITSKDGYHIVVIFHAPFYTFRFLEPYATIAVYGPSGEKIGQSQCVEKYRKSIRTTDGIAVGNNCFEGQYPWYKLFWKSENIELDLLLKSQIKSWKLERGLLFQENEGKGRCFDWDVPVPRAEVTGSLKIKDRLFKVDGVGYSDHNWGNFVLTDVFSWWYWGRIFTDKYTLIYADIEKKSGHITPFILAENGKVVISTRNGKTLQDFWTCKSADSRIPQQLILRVKDGKDQIELKTKVNRIMEKIEFLFNPFHSPFPRRIFNDISDRSYFLSHAPIIGRSTKYWLKKSVYLRLLVTYDLKINSIDRFTGKSIQEIMLLRPPFN